MLPNSVVAKLVLYRKNNPLGSLEPFQTNKSKNLSILILLAFGEFNEEVFLNEFLNFFITFFIKFISHEARLNEKRRIGLKIGAIPRTLIVFPIWATSISSDWRQLMKGVKKFISAWAKIEANTKILQRRRSLVRSWYGTLQYYFIYCEDCLPLLVVA